MTHEAVQQKENRRSEIDPRQSRIKRIDNVTNLPGVADHRSTTKNPDKPNDGEQDSKDEVGVPIPSLGPGGTVSACHRRPIILSGRDFGPNEIARSPRAAHSPSHALKPS